MSLLTDAGFIIVDSYLVLLEVIDATEATLSTVVALRCASAAPAPDHFYNNNNTITSNHFHNKLKGRNGVAAVLEFFGSNFVHNEKCRLAKGLDECGRTPLALLAALAKKKSHTLTSTAVNLVYYNEDALITRDKEGKTPIDIALGSGACAEIISLLSQTPEEAYSLGLKGMRLLYAPFLIFWNDMMTWIESRLWADCHKFMNEHDDELVREVLKHDNSDLFIQISQQSQKYTESLVFLALRMIHRHPLSLAAISFQGGLSPLKMAEHPQCNACLEIRKVFRLTPKYISSTPFPTLLRQHLPKQFVDDEIYSP